MPIPCKHCPHCETCSPTNVGAVCKPVHGMELLAKAETKSQIIKNVCIAAGIEFVEIPLTTGGDPLDFTGLPTITKQLTAMDVLALAHKTDQVFHQSMRKNLNREQWSIYCFENGITNPVTKQVEALQDGECPCCHGSWPSPDAIACNGCGYRLDEE